MKKNPSAKPQNPGLVIRIHLTDGSVESFVVKDEAEAQKIWDSVEPARLFAPGRLVLAGERFKSVFVTAQIVRVDFVHGLFACWKFTGGYSDIVELSEAEFRKNARLDQPEQMPRREEHTPVGDLMVSFLKLNLAGGMPLFLMVEAPVKLPIESQSFMRFMLSKGGCHMRLRGGGIGVVNLANLVGYTVYPGVEQLPADTWLAEQITNQA